MRRSRRKLAKAQWQRLEPLRPGSAGLPGRKGFSNHRRWQASSLAGVPWPETREPLGG